MAKHHLETPNRETINAHFVEGVGILHIATPCGTESLAISRQSRESALSSHQESCNNVITSP